MNVRKRMLGMSERKYQLEMKKLDVQIEKVKNNPLKNMNSADMSIMFSVRCAIRWGSVAIFLIGIIILTCDTQREYFKSTNKITEIEADPKLYAQFKYLDEIRHTTQRDSAAVFIIRSMNGK